MAAYRRVYDSRHLQADCQESGTAPEAYARQSSMRYLYLEHELALANTMFKQHPRRLYTWTSPDGNTRRLHLNCAMMENKLDKLSHESGSRLQHRSSVACGYTESQVG